LRAANIEDSGFSMTKKNTGEKSFDITAVDEWAPMKKTKRGGLKRGNLRENWHDY